MEWSFTLVRRVLDLIVRLKIIMRSALVNFFIPLVLVMTALAAFVVCLCLGDSVPDDITGPSGSDMICVFYFPLHLLLWVVVGPISLLLFSFRVRSMLENTERNLVLGIFGYLLALTIFIIAAVLTPKMSDFLTVALASFIVNFIPILIVMSIGILIMKRARKRHSGQKLVESEKNIFHPSLN